MELEEAINSLWGPSINSTNRLCRLLEVTETFQPSEFWATFQQGWMACDDTWFTQPRLVVALRKHAPASSYLTGEDLNFWNALPDEVIIYRGCSPERRTAVSWTTDQRVAEGFARGHRGIHVSGSKVHRAVIAKEKIYSVVTDRGEQEVIVDPADLMTIV